MKIDKKDLLENLNIPQTSGVTKRETFTDIMNTPRKENAPDKTAAKLYDRNTANETENKINQIETLLSNEVKLERDLIQTLQLPEKFIKTPDYDELLDLYRKSLVGNLTFSKKLLEIMKKEY